MIRGWSARLSDPWVGRSVADRPAAARGEREVRRRCACDGRVAGGSCSACGGKKPKLARRAAGGAFDLAQVQILPALEVSQPGDPSEVAADADAAAALRDPATERSDDAPSAPEGTGGTPLPDDLRADFERRFDHDFSPVRIHTDAAANESAAALDAEAYTIGGDIVFGEGRFSPGSGEGRDLLAHELAHVAQATGGEAGAGTIQRRRGKGGQDDCSQAPKPKDPCSKIPEEHRRRVQAINLKKFPDDFAALESQLLRKANADNAAERVALLKAAACELDGSAATSAREALDTRHTLAGKRFGRLSTASRCAILHILDLRIAATAAAEVDADAEPATAKRDKRAAADPPPRDQGGKGGKRKRSSKKDELAVARAALDRELLAKAGQPDVLSFLLPEHTRHARIQYSDMIQNDLLRFHARINERGTFAVGKFGLGSQVVLAPATNLLATIWNFFECLIDELGEADSAMIVEALEADPLGVLKVPAEFNAGAVVGIGEDMVDAIKQLADIIEDPEKFATDVIKLMKIAFSPEGMELGCALGGDIGAEFVETLRKAAPEGLDELAYETGRAIGPAIVYTAIAFLLPEVSISALGGKVLQRLLKILAAISDKLPVPKSARKATKKVAKLAGKVRPHEGRINVGGRFEPDARNASNLNPELVEGIPNHVPGTFEQIADKFEPGSASEILSNKVPAVDVGDWPAAAKGAREVLAEGGRLDLDLWGQAEDIEAAYAAIKAVFPSAKLELHGAGGIITAVK
jgi:hypothetical protein